MDDREQTGSSPEEPAAIPVKGKEMNNFYKALASVQVHAVFRVMCGKNTEEMKKNAVEETKRLHEIYNKKCPIGTVLNPKTGECE